MNIAIAMGCCGLLAMGSQAFAQESQDTYSQKALLKNWALSRCLAQVYTDESSKNDANATASAYLEQGRQPITAYEELSALVEKYAKRTYEGSIKSDFNTMKCIDLLNSKELESKTLALTSHHHHKNR